MPLMSKSDFFNLGVSLSIVAIFAYLLDQMLDGD